MKGTVLLLCAITIAQAVQPQLTLSGKVCYCDPGQAAGVCSQYGSDNSLIVHENCNQFYKCAHGQPIAYFCPGITLYNPLAETCDWPYNVDCGDRPIVEAPEPEDGGSGDNSGNGNVGGNNDPAQAPGICAASGSDGVMVAHEHCNWFYKCAHGVPVAMHCDTNLLYNSVTGQCDWPNNVDCAGKPVVEPPTTEDNDGEIDCEEEKVKGECNCNPAEAPQICAASGSDGELVAHENCRKFYKCAHGVPVAFSCYGILLYNPYTKQCDWPENVDCGDRYCYPLGTEPEDNGSSGGGSNDNGGSGTDNGGSGAANDGNGTDNDESGTDNGGSGTDNGGSGTDNNDGTCNCKPEEAPGICATDGSDGVLIAHENCNQFYQCAHGKPVANNCSSPLLYNPYTQHCDWPHSVDCGDKPIAELDPVKPVDPVDPDSEENGGSGTCNCNPQEAPGICATDGSDGVLIAHENCNQFYQCTHGKPVVHKCNSPLLYNPYNQQCDWPHAVDCVDRPIAELDPVKPVVPVDPESGENGGSGTDNGEGGTDNGGSGTDNGGNGTDNGEGGTDNGGSGTDNGGSGTDSGGNDTDNGGNGTDNGGDGTDTGGDGTDTGGSGTNNGEGGTDNGGSGTDNGGNGTDNEGSGTDNGGSETDNEGSSTDNNDNGNTDEDCDEESNTCNCDPAEAGSICSVAGSDGTFVAHENCNQFYQCAHGRPVPIFCSGELLYNPLIERCDWPHLVECGDRPIVENEGGNEDNEDDNGSGDNGGTDNVGTCNCNPEEAPAICSASGSDGTNVAHQHCNWFYTCAHGVPVPLLCSGNLLYNPYTGRCDWPHNVECGTRPIVPVERESSEEENSDSSESDGNCDPSQAPAICAASVSDGTLVAHENCNQYYICAQGSPVPAKCPSNLLFNPKLNDCDWPYNVDCGDRLVPDNGESDGPCACDARQAPSICAGAGSDGKLIAHEQCNQYWVCASGAPVARSCPPSLLYEPHSERCLWPAAVSCEGRSLSTYASLNKHLQARRGL